MSEQERVKLEETLATVVKQLYKRGVSEVSLLGLLEIAVDEAHEENEKESPSLAHAARAFDK